MTELGIDTSGALIRNLHDALVVYLFEFLNREAAKERNQVNWLSLLFGCFEIISN